MTTDGKGDYKVVVPDQHEGGGRPSIVAPSVVTLSPAMRAALPIASYCFASILMTVTNKYVVSGYGFNMNFLLLTVQVSQRPARLQLWHSLVCIYSHARITFFDNRMLSLFYCYKSSSSSI